MLSYRLHRVAASGCKGYSPASDGFIKFIRVIDTILQRIGHLGDSPATVTDTGAPTVGTRNRSKRVHHHFNTGQPSARTISDAKPNDGTEGFRDDRCVYGRMSRVFRRLHCVTDHNIGCDSQFRQHQACVAHSAQELLARFWIAIVELFSLIGLFIRCCATSQIVLADKAKVGFA